jgi:hypothetical protein
VAKQKFKITNWKTYNKALINRGSDTFWLVKEAIQAWYESGRFCRIKALFGSMLFF